MKVKAKKWLIKRVVCFASALEVYDFNLTIVREDDSSYCTVKKSGRFVINLDNMIKDREQLTRHLAHEMVHLRQIKRDQLVELEEGVSIWNGEKHPPARYMSKEYFLAPWEMEARALEDWLMHKWRFRDRELH